MTANPGLEAVNKLLALKLGLLLLARGDGLVGGGVERGVSHGALEAVRLIGGRTAQHVECRRQPLWRRRRRGGHARGRSGRRGGGGCGGGGGCLCGCLYSCL